MAKFPDANAGMRHGTGSPRVRCGDSGSPSSDTAWASEPEAACSALRDQPRDRRQVEADCGRRRGPTANRKTGPNVPNSTVLSAEDEAVIVASRGTRSCRSKCGSTTCSRRSHTCRGRTCTHRCLQRHGISRLPETDGDKPLQAKFKRYPRGYIHVDIAEVHTEEGRLYLLVAIDRTSKFAIAELHEKATRRVAGDFLRALAAAVPYKIHAVLTDNNNRVFRRRAKL